MSRARVVVLGAMSRGLDKPGKVEPMEQVFSQNTVGGQDVTHTAIYKLETVEPTAMLRVVVHVDSYAFQSFARVEVFSPALNKWNFLHALHYSNMQSKRVLDDKRVNYVISNHAEDVESLLEVARLILSGVGRAN